MTMTAIIEKEDRIQRFAELYQKGVDAWLEAGRIIVELVDEIPDAREQLVARLPHMNRYLLDAFECIGRKQLHPLLLIGSSIGAQRLALMNYSDQEKYLNEPIPLLVETDNGTDTLLVKVEHLSKAQCDQVFAARHVRSMSEQKVFVADRKSKELSKLYEMPVNYRIHGRKVILMKNSTYSKSDLRRILDSIPD